MVVGAMAALDEEAACLTLKVMKSVLNLWKDFEKTRSFWVLKAQEILSPRRGSK